MDNPCDFPPLASLIHDPDEMLRVALAMTQAQKGRAAAQDQDPQAPVQLPQWPDERRGIPNEVVRSALFNVRNRRTRRDYLKNHPIAVIGEGRITYTGEELRQDDEDVWLQIMHLARRQPLGEWVAFSAYAILKALGWPNSGQSYTRLRECLVRMNATALTVHSKRLGKGSSVSLIRKFEWEDAQGRRFGQWRVWIEPEMKALFGDVHYTHLEWRQRLNLGPLAKWLQGIYGSHAEPFPMKVHTLRQGCGSEAKELWKFREKLRAALNELKAVDFLQDWEIDGRDLVHVVRSGRKRE